MNILVLGLGISGVGAVKALVKNKFNVIAVDKVDDLRILDLDIRYIVKSPGIYNDELILAKAREKGIMVISDIELAYLLKPMKYIGITGTNGKSTVTTLVYEMMKDKALLGGNIGLSICEEAVNSDKEYAVCELSSFQLDDIKAFKPHIACILNLDDDHLKYHGSIENYHKAKLKLIHNFKENDTLIINRDLLYLVKDRVMNIITFDETFIQDNKIIVDDFSINLNDLKVVGMHNYLNIIASVLIVKQVGVENGSIKKVLRDFKGLPYRLQFVGNVNYKAVYNDSKATNIDSTNKAIEAFDESIILLVGGYDKGQDYRKLNLTNVVKVIAFGAVRDRVSNELSNVTSVETIDEAFDVALESQGNVILFSPAHSSYDKFASYEERGNYFDKLVMKKSKG